MSAAHVEGCCLKMEGDVCEICYQIWMDVLHKWAILHVGFSCC